MKPLKYLRGGALLWDDMTMTVDVMKVYSRRCRLPRGEYTPISGEELLQPMQQYHGLGIRRVLSISPERN